MTIDPLSEAPLRGEPEDIFVPKANAMAAGLPVFVQQVNAAALQMGEDREAAALSASNAATSAEAAATSELIAKGAANYQGDYHPARTYAVGESVTYAENQLVKKSTAPSGTTPVDGPDWLDLTGGVPKDIGDLITTTQDLSADGWLKADGSVYLQTSYAALFAQLGQTAPLFPAAGSSTLADQPDIQPNGQSYGTAFSPDGSLVFIGHASSPYITAYERSGSTLTKRSFLGAASPPYTVNSLDVSPDGSLLLAASENSPYVAFYSITGSGASAVITKLANPAVLPGASAKVVRFSPDGNYVAIGCNHTSGVKLYSVSGTTLTHIGVDTNIAYGRCLAWSPDSQFLAAGGNNGGLATAVYKVSPSGGVEQPGPASPAVALHSAVSWSPNGNYLAFGVSDGIGSKVKIYDASDPEASMPHIGGDAGEINYAPNEVAWASNDQLTVAIGGTPYLYTLQRTATGFVNVPNPIDVANQLYEVRYSHDLKLCMLSVQNVKTQVVQCYGYDIDTEFAVPAQTAVGAPSIVSWLKAE